MRSKLLTSAAALALLTGAVVASVGPASAQNWNHGGHWNHGGWNGGWHGGWHGGGWGWPAAAAAGLIGGTIAAATSPLWAPGYYDSYDSYSPGYAYGGDSYAPYGYSNGYAYRGGGYDNGYGAPQVGAAPGTAVAQGDTVAYCQSRYKSYDPASGTFLGFDGQRHPCP